VAAIAFGQRERHGTVALSTIIAGKNCKHVYRIGVDLFDEYLIVAILAIQPFGMGFMWKHD
jgi:hypothetical protein